MKIQQSSYLYNAQSTSEQKNTVPKKSFTKAPVKAQKTQNFGGDKLGGLLLRSIKRVVFSSGVDGYKTLKALPEANKLVSEMKTVGALKAKLNSTGLKAEYQNVENVYTGVYKQNGVVQFRVNHAPGSRYTTHIVSYEELKPDGKVDVRLNYQNSGVIQSYEKIRPNGKLWVKNSYSNKGNLQSSHFYTKNGVREKTTIYDLGNGNRVNEEVLHPNGKTKTSKYYNPKTGKIKLSQGFNKDGSPLYEINYNTQGKATQEKYFNKKGEVASEYRYDDNGVLIK